MATVTKTKAKGKQGGRNIRVRAAAEKSVVVRKSRTRPVATTKIEAGDAKAMDSMLKSISRIDSEIAARHAEREVTVKKLWKLMKTYKLSTHSAHGVIANVFRPKGRASATIDPHEYRKLVSDDDFMDSIRVMKAEAEKNLSKKELERITDVTAATLGEETIEVKKAELG